MAGQDDNEIDGDQVFAIEDASTTNAWTATLGVSMWKNADDDAAAVDDGMQRRGRRELRGGSHCLG